MDEPERYEPEADESGPRRRVETADFAPVAIGGPSRRSRAALFTGAWLLALVAVVGVGVLGRSNPDHPALVPGAVAASALSTAPSAEASHGDTALGPILGVPRAADQVPLVVTIRPTARGISVAGSVLIRSVTTISIDVVDGEGQSMAAEYVAVGDPDGGIRPGLQPVFSTFIGLPSAYRGAALVEVDAYDALGNTIGSALHWLGFAPSGCPPGASCRSG